MANQLEMGAKEAIARLYEQGWKKRRIARELGYDRKTVRRYIQELTESKSPISPAGKTAAKGTISPAGNAGRVSKCEAYRGVIEEAIKQGLCAQRIYQDLKVERDFPGSYDSVKRFVRRQFPDTEARIWRMESLPGQEAQVDFGAGGPILDGEHKRRSYVLRIVLCYSRKGYSESVQRQDTETFIRCLENSFRYFGGVPETLTLDNLKAAVQQADWYDPELNPKIIEFARHYGIVILPIRSYTPEHNGKAESSVHYVKRNALKGRTFASLTEQNVFLLDWEKNVADCRIHGTTRQQVAKLFADEKSALKPLPPSLFPCFQEGKRIVHRDSYVEVAKAYYQAPPEHIGREVWVRWDAHLVRIFNLKFEQIAVMARKAPGQFSEVLGSRGRSTQVEHTIEYWYEKTVKLGEHCGLWADKIIEVRGAWGIRVLQGLMALTRRHSAREIEEACRLAMGHGQYHLRQIRSLIQNPVEQQELEFLSVHPLIRDIKEYGLIAQNKQEITQT